MAITPGFNTTVIKTELDARLTLTVEDDELGGLTLWNQSSYEPMKWFAIGEQAEERLLSTLLARKNQRDRRPTEWQFARKSHGSLYDRGRADSYYGRVQDPHYGGVGGDSGPRVEVTDEVSVREYKAGYEANERSGDRKEWD